MSKLVNSTVNCKAEFYIKNIKLQSLEISDSSVNNYAAIAEYKVDTSRGSYKLQLESAQNLMDSREIVNVIRISDVTGLAKWIDPISNNIVTRLNSGCCTHIKLSNLQWMLDYALERLDSLIDELLK